MDAMHEYRSPVPTLVRVGRFIWALKWFFAGIAVLNFGGFVVGPIIAPSGTPELLQWIIGANAMGGIWIVVFVVYLIICHEMLPALRRIWENTK